MTEFIYYTNKMAFSGKNFLKCEPTKFIERLQNELPSFELIPNETNVKYYFDVDYYTEQYNDIIANAIEKKSIEYITTGLQEFTGIIPNIAIATSHCNTKYSFRFYVSNLLDKKPNIKSFVKKLNHYIKMKVDIDNIYDYIEELDKPFFDEGIYDTDRKMRCLNTSKDNENRPLLLKEGLPENTIISSYFDNDAKVVNYPIETTTSITNNIQPLSFNDKNDKYLNLLFNVIGNGSYIDFNTWFHIAGILKYNNYSFDILEQYTSIVDRDNPKTFKIWNSITTNKPFAIFGLQSIAKKVNESGYYQWLQKYCEYISLDTLSAGANDICQFISKSLNNTLVFTNGSWLTCNKDNLWITIKDPSAIIVSAIQADIDKTMKLKTDLLLKPDTTDDVKDKLRADIKQLVNYRVATNNQMNSYTKLLMTYLCNDDFYSCLDTNKYEVAFKNGILDLRTLNFRVGILPTDFLTKTIPFDYMKANEEDKNFVRNELKKITNNSETHLNYYLSILGYAMTGDASRIQEFYYLLGQKACNGKSVVFEALTEIMPNYVVKTGNDIFEKNNNTRHKEMARWNGIRICWADELTKNKQDVELLKELTNGTSLTYKALYKNSVVLNVLFSLFIVSNHTLNFDIDEGLKRRLRTLQMDSEFVTDLAENDEANCRFKRDNTFGIKLCNEYKYALLELIFDYSKQFVDDEYKLKAYPIEWLKENNDICESENYFKEWFENTFEFGKDFEISKYNFKRILKHSEFSNYKLRDEYKKNRWNINGTSNSWKGFREKQITETE